MGKKSDKKRKKLTEEQIIYLAELNTYLKSVEENKSYSIQRFDIIIIVVLTSSIFLITTLISGMKEPNCGTIFLKMSITLFVVSIISNLVSQHFGYMSSNSHFEICKKKIYDLQYHGKVTMFEEEERIAQKEGVLVGRLNDISLAATIIGIAISTIFYWIAM